MKMITYTFIEQQFEFLLVFSIDTCGIEPHIDRIDFFLLWKCSNQIIIKIISEQMPID
jgi:hypothetical protein